MSGVKKVIGQVPENECQKNFVLRFQDIENRVNEVKTQRDHKAKGRNGEPAEQKRIAQHAAARNLLHEPGQKCHDEEGGDGINHIHDGQVLNAVSFQEGGFCEIVKQDAGRADQEKKQNNPKKQRDLIFIDFKPFPQDFQH